jgi:hypothetical protein
MKTRTKVEACPVCRIKPVAESLPVCASCWRGVPHAESIAYFAAVDRAIFAVDPAKAIRQARARVAFVLRGR